MKDVIAVDLDGTLAKYSGYKGDDIIGEPISPMIDKVKELLDNGTKVKIFTARTNSDKFIKDWCRNNLGQELEITNIKEPTFKEIWDDRARQVIPNTGRFIDEDSDMLQGIGQLAGTLKEKVSSGAKKLSSANKKYKKSKFAQALSKFSSKLKQNA